MELAAQQKQTAITTVQKEAQSNRDAETKLEIADKQIEAAKEQAEIAAEASDNDSGSKS